MKTLQATAICITVLAMSFTSHAGDNPSTTLRAGKAGKHLFILSGQSNMAHMKSGTFNAAVEKAFGKDNVTVVRNAKTGAPIRLWDKDYKWPEDMTIPQGRKKPGRKEKTKEEFVAEFGTRYDTLMDAVKKHTEGKTYDTVTFVWMQGESDSKKEMTDLYPDSFNRLIARLKTDLNIESLNIVIGRLSDCGLGNPNWVRLREFQMKYAEDNPNAEWVNTDDLNNMTKDDGSVKQGLHYTKEGYDSLGQRFAEKAIALIKTN